MQYYAVIDTNVLVSAMLNWCSVPGRIVFYAFSGMIIPLFNDDILQEYRTVLLREKFHLSEDIVDDVIQAFEESGNSVEAEKLDLLFDDPKDIVFYEVVMQKRKEEDAYLITGNTRHFPQESFIVTPREMLEMITAEDEAPGSG